MSHTELDRLADLALDSPDVPEDARRHAAACPECAALVVALVDTRRKAGEEPLVAAPADVRRRVLSEVSADLGAGGSVRVTEVGTVRTPRPDDRGRRRGVPPWLAAVAAALALIAGVGLGRIGTGPTSPPEATAPPAETGEVVAATLLTALDSDASRGKASAVRSDDTVTLRVRARELGDEDGFHEVWLLNIDGTRMVALGVLAEGDEGEFQVPRGLLDEGYRIVDISVEPGDGDPAHSGVSLARGELA